MDYLKNDDPKSLGQFIENLKSITGGNYQNKNLKQMYDGLNSIFGGSYQQPSPPPLFPPIKKVAPNKKDLKSPLTKKFSPFFYRQLQRKNSNATVLTSKKQIRDIKDGLTMPEITSLRIGSAKRMIAAVLFFDLKDFTQIVSKMENEKVLTILNIVIPRMMDIVKWWQGEIEKNTGDGIMAIFGTETRNDLLIARDALESAMTMRYFMVSDVNPKLLEIGLPPLHFRIGIDMGELLISRIGIEKNNFLAVVGDAGNRASKLQELAEPDGICIGHDIFINLLHPLPNFCVPAKDTTGKLESDYRFYHFTGSWPAPENWLKMKF